jgi:hypothetical protein
MPRTTQLNTSGTVTLDAAGAGTVDLQVPTLQTWRVTKLAVRVSSNTLEPTAIVYVDSAAPGNILGSTYTGSGDSSNEDQVLMPGQRLLCAWTGGDVGAQATLSVFGTQTG